MLQCITLGSSSTENDGDESEDGINLNITARVSPIYINRLVYLFTKIRCCKKKPIYLY